MSSLDEWQAIQNEKIRLMERMEAGIAGQHAEIDRLRKGIQDYLDGNYGRSKHFKSKHDKCPHGLFSWEACENCIDEHFTALLAVPNGR